MLPIIIMILKSLGILILILIGVILAVLLLVLYVPLRYRIEGSYYGSPKGKARLSWLFHIVSVTAAYEGQFSIVVRLFGFHVCKPKEENEEDSEDMLVHAMEAEDKAEGGIERHGAVAKQAQARKRLWVKKRRSEKKPPQEKKQPREEEPPQEKKQLREEKLPQEEKTPREEEPPQEKKQLWEEEPPQEKKQPREEEPPQEKKQLREEEPLQAQKPPQGKTRHTGGRSGKKHWDPAGRISAFWAKLKLFFNNAFKKVKSISKKKEMIQSWISKKGNQKMLKRLLKQAKKLLRHLFPKKGKLEVAFGFDDPYVTGQVLAVASVVYPFCHKHVQICPVFDRKVFTAEGFFVGRIRLGTLLFMMGRMMLDKKFRALLKRWFR